METSENSDVVIAAFAKALADMPEVHKDKKVNAGPMKYSYADLATVLSTVRPALAKHGLAVSQWPTAEGIGTMVVHEKGEWIKFPPFQAAAFSGTAQQNGSAITYSRRYALLSVLGIATEDDDGHAASRPAAPAVDPKKERIDTLVGQMRDLDDVQKAAIKDFAAEQEKSLAPKSLAADDEWLQEVESFVEMLTETLDNVEDES